MPAGMRYLPLVFVLLVTACRHTVPYQVAVASNPPGAHIEYDNEDQGVTPVTITVQGGHNGAFDNRSRFHTLRAIPAQPGQYVQQKIFFTGWDTSKYTRDTKDYIPKSIFFNMTVHTLDPKVDVELHAR